MLALHGKYCKVCDVMWEIDGRYRFNPPGTISPTRRVALFFREETLAIIKFTNICFHAAQSYVTCNIIKSLLETSNLEQFNPNSLHGSPEKSFNFTQAVTPGLFSPSRRAFPMPPKSATLIVRAITLLMIGVAITRPSFGVMILVAGFAV